MALRILDGADERTLTRYADMMLAIPSIAGAGAGAKGDEDARRKRQEEWLARAAARPPARGHVSQD